ncbi:M24 family metallopeptidase [Mycolicibacterium hodleri]|uniref:Aminopeptidase P family protein n=1 Tax=Mycolicibacterium hodleri TaxID=49897 RepID=A0A502DV04_9MYCO|nr:M24 family metallopeptidase [Mycolicibacterium hodleri]TPG28056.1 aminopeptidase P family protein [Mycolicibacterium hodleri]
MTPTAESTRVESLRDAELKAHRLFDEVVARGLIAVGVSERRLSDQIRDLAADMFGTTKFWHKRIVRAGANTMEPYAENPPDRTLAADDILFLDFGPIFAEWEADFGRTYVLGDDPTKHRLAEDLPRIWEAGRAHFADNPDITGAQLFSFVTGVIADAGWGHVGEHVGHLVGEFPHVRVDGDKVESYIASGNTNPMRRLDAAGQDCHWILEVHLVDRERGFGGFFEQLLDIPSQ